MVTKAAEKIKSEVNISQTQLNYQDEILYDAGPFELIPTLYLLRYISRGRTSAKCSWTLHRGWG